MKFKFECERLEGHLIIFPCITIGWREGITIVVLWIQWGVGMWVIKK